MDDRVRKLYIDLPSDEEPIQEDDFLVAIGQKQSNSIYHVLESRGVPHKTKDMVKYHLKTLKTDLITALMRDKYQQLIPVQWYSREKKT